jgi:mRNA interferase HigB
MRIISRRTLLIFCENNPEAYRPLDRWYRVMKSARYQSFSELKQAFRSADVYKEQTIFDIGGNKYRLIAELRYAIQTVYIQCVLTHQDYDKGDWKHGP